VPDGVDVRMQPMQPPVTYAQRDALRRDACSDQLRSGHHPELGTP
jgi:hypothetical protein